MSTSYIFIEIFNKIYTCLTFLIFFKGFTRLFASKSTHNTDESPRLREFRKKLRERAPIGMSSHAVISATMQRLKILKTKDVKLPI